MLFVGMVIGGLLAVTLLYIILDWLVISHLMDDPFKGKMLAAISAYFIAASLYSVNTGTVIGFLTYLPGALLVGWLGSRSAKKIQAKIDAEDHTSTFE